MPQGINQPRRHPIHKIFHKRQHSHLSTVSGVSTVLSDISDVDSEHLFGAINNLEQELEGTTGRRNTSKFSYSSDYDDVSVSTNSFFGEIPEYPKPKLRHQNSGSVVHLFPAIAEEAGGSDIPEEYHESYYSSVQYHEPRAQTYRTSYQNQKPSRRAKRYMARHETWRRNRNRSSPRHHHKSRGSVSKHSSFAKMHPAKSWEKSWAHDAADHILDQVDVNFSRGNSGRHRQGSYINPHDAADKVLNRFDREYGGTGGMTRVLNTSPRNQVEEGGHVSLIFPQKEESAHTVHARAQSYHETTTTINLSGLGRVLMSRRVEDEKEIHTESSGPAKSTAASHHSFGSMDGTDRSVTTSGRPDFPRKMPRTTTKPAIQNDQHSAKDNNDQRRNSWTNEDYGRCQSPCSIM